MVCTVIVSLRPTFSDCDIGLPQPVNLETAISVENIIRSTGAIPATIAIIKGQPHIGLTRKQLEYIADVSSIPKVVKVSRRDIAPTMALGLDGGTTISGTMVLAAHAGIKARALFPQAPSVSNTD